MSCGRENWLSSQVTTVKAHATDGRVTDIVHAASDKAAGKRPIG